MLAAGEQNAIADPFYVTRLRSVANSMDSLAKQLIRTSGQALAELPSSLGKLFGRIDGMHNADIQCLLGIDLFSSHDQPARPVGASKSC